MTATFADSHDGLVEQLDAQVRDVVRREGVDPQRDAALVRRIADTVVRAHDERSLTGAVAPVPDAQAMVGELVARVSGFGPLQPFLDDPAVEEIWINDTNSTISAGQRMGAAARFVSHSSDGEHARRLRSVSDHRRILPV